MSLSYAAAGLGHPVELRPGDASHFGPGVVESAHGEGFFCAVSGLREPRKPYGPSRRR